MLDELPLQTPKQSTDFSHVFCQYTVLSEIRDAVAKQLREQKIGYAGYYPMPLPKQ